MGFLSNLFKSKSNTPIVKVLGKLAFLEVDMHNHILPGIDDGSADTAQSISLIKGLSTMGFQKFICTPHIMDGVHPNTKCSIARSYSELNKALREEGQKAEIFAAAEHMIDDGLQLLIERDDLSLMPGGYVLIEMSYLSESKALFQVIRDIQELGYKPILAHPERYSYFHYNFDMYKQIKDAGCLMQLNLLAISRYYGTEVKVAALTMIKSGMYDFVGTDVHHERHLNALIEVTKNYPIRELLKTCNIQNTKFLDHWSTVKSTIAVG